MLTEQLVEFPVEDEKLVQRDFALVLEFATRSMLGLFRADAMKPWRLQKSQTRSKV